MNVLEIFETIQKNWALLVFVFTLGGIWWQGKAWFKKIETSLTRDSADHTNQTAMLQSIHDKIENLEDRTTKIEETVIRIHEEQHEQEVKLAVLESVSEVKSARRKTSRS
jgi:hypothetical protein